jgi:subtilisin-like proprotein convertase family protein
MVISCKSEPKGHSDQMLEGDWSLEAATRDNVETGTLENLFLQFDSTNKRVRTNIFGGTDDYSFNLKGDSILLNDENQFKLVIVSLEDSLLVMQMEINQTPFKLWFVR